MIKMFAPLRDSTTFQTPWAQIHDRDMRARRIAIAYRLLSEVVSTRRWAGKANTTAFSEDLFLGRSDISITLYCRDLETPITDNLTWTKPLSRHHKPGDHTLSGRLQSSRLGGNIVA
jgi:hypothetical protein